MPVNLLLARASPRCNIPEVENEKIDYPVLRVKFMQEYTAYQEIKKFFMAHTEFTHLVLATDDIVVKNEHLIQLQTDLEVYDFPVICGMMNIDEKDYPKGRLTISPDLPDKITKECKYFTTETDLPIGLFPVKWNGFALMAIRRDIIERYEFKADSTLCGGTDPAFGGAYDTVFCWWCHENNIPIYCDSRIDMKHLRQSGRTRLGEEKPDIEFNS